MTERSQADLPWYRRVMRWGQTNIREIDALPEHYDIGWWVDYWRRTRVQGVIVAWATKSPRSISRKIVYSSDWPTSVHSRLCIKSNRDFGSTQCICVMCGGGSAFVRCSIAWVRS